MAAGVARSYGDDELSRQYGAVAELFGIPLRWDGQKFFLFGVMPMGDAFAVWSRTARPLATGREDKAFAESPGIVGIYRGMLICAGLFLMLVALVGNLRR